MAAGREAFLEFIAPYRERLTLLTGNHDPDISPHHHLELAGGRVLVTHGDVHIQGMLLTLKLLDWDLADQLPEYLARIRSWGFRFVRARQLAHNRQEVCVAALRRRSQRRQSLLTKRSRRRRTP